LSNEVVSAFFSEINALLQSSSLTSTAIAELTRSIVRDDKWKHRLSRPGPFFLMSYKEAKIPDNDYHRNGSEMAQKYGCFLLTIFSGIVAKRQSSSPIPM